MSDISSSVQEENVATMLPQVPLNGQLLTKGEIDDDDKEYAKEIEELIATEDCQEFIHDEFTIESTIVGEPDIFYNKTKYENGDTNILFITGYSGGGKSTMSKGEKKWLRDVVDMDRIVLYTNKSDEYFKNMGKFADSYMNEGPGRKFRISEDKGVAVRNIDDKFRKSISQDMIKYAKSYARDHKTTKLILEGVWIYRYIEPSEADDCAVYIKGTSLATSTSRAIDRDNSIEKSHGKGNAVTRLAHAGAKNFMAIKDLLTRHLEKWQKYFKPKYEAQLKANEKISIEKKAKNQLKGVIHDGAGFIKKVTESGIDIMDTEVLCESFEDSVINKAITGSKVSFKTRKLISKIYSLKIKIAELEEKDVDEESNKKLIDMKKDYVNKKSELLKIKKAADPKLKKAISELEDKAKKDANETIAEIKKKKEEKEAIEEGVTCNDLAGLYMTEMNHMTGVAENLMTGLKEKLQAKDASFVKKDEVIKNVEDGDSKLKELEGQFSGAKKAFETAYNKYKGTKIGEKTLDEWVTYEPTMKDTGFVALYLKLKNSYTYCQSDCLIYFASDSDEKCDIVTFTAILHNVRKILAEAQKLNKNKNAIFKLYATREKGKKEIKLMLMIRSTVGSIKKIVKEGVEDIVEAAKDRDGDGKLEVSPELKRLDEKRGRLAELENSLKEAQKKLDETGERIYENKVKGLTAKIDKLKDELKEGDKKLASEEKQQAKTDKIDEDKSVTESTDDLIMEAADMEDEIRPIVSKLNEKGYKVKYASPGHTKLRKKEDREPDGVYHGKLYSDARIMFTDKYDFPAPPKYWHWREVDGCSYLDITPKGYDVQGNKTPDEAFKEWKSDYMASLRSFVDSLPANGKKESEDKETEESVSEFSESVMSAIFDDMGMNDLEAVGSLVMEGTEDQSVTNTMIKELDNLLS
jgi:hypothetical protein